MNLTAKSRVLTSFVMVAGLAACATDGQPGAPTALCVAGDMPIAASLLHIFRGAPGGSGFGLIGPEQLAVSMNDFWIADRGRGELVRADRDGRRSTMVARMPGRVAGLHVDRLQSVYIALPAQRVVRQYSTDARVEREFRDSDGGMVPVDVVADGTGKVFVADGANARVVIFNRVGQVSGTVGERLSIPNPFVSVNALAQEAGRLLVLDASARKIHIVREDGSMEFRDFGDYVQHPVAVAADPWRRIFVGDQDGRILVFDARRANTITELQGTPRVAMLGDLWIDETGVLHLADTVGAAVYSLLLPAPCP